MPRDDTIVTGHSRKRSLPTEKGCEPSPKNLKRIQQQQENHQQQQQQENHQQQQQQENLQRQLQPPPPLHK